MPTGAKRFVIENHDNFSKTRVFIACPFAVCCTAFAHGIANEFFSHAIDLIFSLWICAYCVGGTEGIIVAIEVSENICQGLCCMNHIPDEKELSKFILLKILDIVFLLTIRVYEGKSIFYRPYLAWFAL